MAAFRKTPRMLLGEGVPLEEILLGIGAHLLTEEAKAEASARAMGKR